MATPFVTITLRAPVQVGKNSEPVTELALVGTGRALRDLTVPLGADGDLKIMMIKPYELCAVGLRMAGVSGDRAFLDQMDARDVWEVGQAVLGFIMDGPQTGNMP